MAATVTHIGVGTQAWFETKKKRARYLVRMVDDGYVELGVLLHELYETPKNNDPRQAQAFVIWSKYQNWGEFCEVELGLQRRKAQRLRHVGRVLAVDLAAAPEEVKKRLIALGWTKFNEISRIFEHFNDSASVEKWTNFAAEHTYPEVMRAVQEALFRAGCRHGQMVPNIGDEDGDEDEDEGEDFEDAEDDEDLGEDGPAPEVDSEAEIPGFSKGRFDVSEYIEGASNMPPKPKKRRVTVEQVAAALPQPTRTKMFSFLCYDEEIDNIFAALTRAKELIQHRQGEKNISNSRLLSLIALDFLATNDFGFENDPKTLRRYLTKLEKLLDIKLIAVVGKEGILHGEKTVTQLMKAIAESKVSEEENNAGGVT